MRPVVAAGERRLSVVPLVGRVRELEIAALDLAADDRGAPAAPRHGRSVRRASARRALAVEFSRSSASSARAPSAAARCRTGTAAHTARSRHSSSSSPGSSRATRSPSRWQSSASVARSCRRRMRPTVAGHLSIVLGLDPGERVADRETLFFSVARTSSRASPRERPTLLVFEDIHWADRACSTWSRCSAARLHDVPCSSLVLARPELLDARPALGRRSPVVHGAAAPAALRGRGARARRGCSQARRTGRPARARARRDGGGQPALHRAARSGLAERRRASRCAADDDPRHRRRAARRTAAARARRAGRRRRRGQGLLGGASSASPTRAGSWRAARRRWSAATSIRRERVSRSRASTSTPSSTC